MFATEALVAAEGVEIFPATEQRVEGDFLRNPPDGVAGFGTFSGMAEDADSAGIGLHASDDAADGGRLSCTVGPEKAETFAVLHFEGDAIDGRERAKALDERIDVEWRGGGHW